MSERRACDICNGPTALTGISCDRCVEWIERGGLIRYEGALLPTPPWRDDRVTR